MFDQVVATHPWIFVQGANSCGRPGIYTSRTGAAGASEKCLSKVSHRSSLGNDTTLLLKELRNAFWPLRFIVRSCRPAAREEANDVNARRREASANLAGINIHTPIFRLHSSLSILRHPLHAYRLAQNTSRLDAVYSIAPLGTPTQSNREYCPVQTHVATQSHKPKARHRRTHAARLEPTRRQADVTPRRPDRPSQADTD